LRSITADRGRGTLPLLAIAAATLAAGGGWLRWARVTVYQTSAAARLEVERAPHPVAAEVAGLVVASHLALGAHVEAGDVLVELDAESQRRQLEAERQHLGSLDPELEALRRQIAAQAQTLRDDRQATLSALEGSHARQREAEVATGLAAEESQRLSFMRSKEAATELDVLRARADEKRKTAAAEAASYDARFIEADQRTRNSQGRSRLGELARELAHLEGEVATTRAAISVLERQVDQHTVRARVAGELGEIAELRAGAFVRQGDHLATVLPPGRLRVVADFASATLGRLRPGQAARVRLDGFPALEYGSLSARVTNVAREARDGLVRVELEVLPPSPVAIPLQHGLPGQVEVAVERASPGVLLLRAAGRLERQEPL
jgi:membrane fusion protein (multidrug efflux system)